MLFGHRKEILKNEKKRLIIIIRNYFYLKNAIFSWVR